MKILTDENGMKFQVDESNLTPYNDKKVKATVLKSLRSEAGAEDYIKVMSSKYPNAVITKSLVEYGEVASLSGDVYAPPMGAPVHVVIEEDMAPVAEVVSVKNVDEMFKTMYRKGLLTSESGMLMPSGKFYELLNEFTSQAMNDYMKSVNPEFEKTEDGRAMVDVISEAYGILKSAGKQALTQEEADNKEGDSRTESLGDKKGAASEALGGQVGPNGNTSTPEKLALSQEEADNKSGDTRTEGLGDKKGAAEDVLGGQVGGSEGNAKTEDIGNAHQAPQTQAISDEEAKGKFGDVQKSAEIHIFKSLSEVNSFVKKNTGYYVDSPTLDETEQYGKRYKYVAREMGDRPAISGFGNRKFKR